MPLLWQSSSPGECWVSLEKPGDCFAAPFLGSLWFHNPADPSSTQSFPDGRSAIKFYCSRPQSTAVTMQAKSLGLSANSANPNVLLKVNGSPWVDFQTVQGSSPNWVVSGRLTPNMTQSGVNRLSLQAPIGWHWTKFEIGQASPTGLAEGTVNFGSSRLMPLEGPVGELSWSDIEPQLDPGVAPLHSWSLRLSIHSDNQLEPLDTHVISKRGAGIWRPGFPGQSGQLLALRVEAECESPLPGQKGLKLVLPSWAAPVANSNPAEAQPNSSSNPNGKPNIIVYLVDTLRCDSLGCYGRSGSTTPNIDKFARDAILFENTRAQSSWTKPSVASILTGHYPWEHRAEDFADCINEKMTTMAEMLTKAGYSTGAIVTNFFVSQQFGFQRGFASFDFLDQKSAQEVNQKAFTWLERRDAKRPFALYLHTLEPHAPYQPPERFLEPGQSARQFSNADLDYMMKLLRLCEEFPSREDLRAEAQQRGQVARKLYQQEVAAADAAFGELLDYLKARGLYDNTLIVFVSDHGEEFLDHGWVGHLNTLYPEVVNVPLLIKPAQARPKGERRVQLAQHIDVLPTLMAQIHNPPTSPALPGRNLLTPESKGSSGAALFSLRLGRDAERFGQGPSRWCDIVGVEWKGWVYQMATSSMPACNVPARGLYRCATDPQEKDNCAFRCLGPQAHLAALLQEVQLKRQAGSSTKNQRQDDLNQHLKSLQYVR